MKVLRRVFDKEIEEYCYLIFNNKQIHFVQTYSHWSSIQLEKEWDELSSNLDLVLLKSYSLREFNEIFFVNFSSLTQFFNSFKKLCYYDYTDFFFNLKNHDFIEFDSIETNKYLQVVAQKGFGFNFIHEVKLDVTKIHNYKGAVAMSLHEENGCYIVAMGIVDDLFPTSTDIEVYAFRKEYLKVLFDSISTKVNLDFCLQSLNEIEFIKKIKHYYKQRVFINNYQVETKLKGYQRKRKINRVLQD